MIPPSSFCFYCIDALFARQIEPTARKQRLVRHGVASRRGYHEEHDRSHIRAQRLSIESPEAESTRTRPRRLGREAPAQRRW